MEDWQQRAIDGRIDRLEDRVAQLERKNWERSMFWFNFVSYGTVTALLVFTAVVIALKASAG